MSFTTGFIVGGIVIVLLGLGLGFLFWVLMHESQAGPSDEGPRPPGPLDFSEEPLRPPPSAPPSRPSGIR